MLRVLRLRLLAVLLAWFSFGVLSLAIVFAGPHTELPLQPLPLLVGLATSLAGFVLAWQLWRVQPSAVRTLFLLAALAFGFSLFWPAVASPGRERRGAVVALVLGVALGVVGVTATARYLREVSSDR
jgi:hypothetical protein